MWVSRTHYETLFENLTRERQKTTDLTAQLAGLRATQDWLTTHVNRLENERSLLTQARLGMTFAVPEILKASEHSSAGVDEPASRGWPKDSIPLAQLMAASMEDPGDDVAGMLGVKHDAHGHLEFTR